MNRFDTFTKKQKDTYALIHELEHELMASVDPSAFVLNEETVALRKQMDEVQAQCDHIWEDGFCIVCGKEEPNT